MRNVVVVSLIVVLVGTAESAAAQTVPLESLFVAHRQPMDFDGHRVSGPGWTLIQETARDAQFVMVGESHNVREIPLFTIQLFEQLHDHAGYNYLAMEDGPYAVEQFVTPERRGRLDSALALAARYPQALQFWNDQEVELLAAVGRISTAAEHPAWGVDNTWGTLHLLDRLAELAPDAAGRTTVAGLRAEAATMEAARPGDDGRFITDGLSEERLETLRAALANAGPEAQRLLGYLQTGYATYAARTDRPAIYVANDTRERLMRSQFLAQYRRARGNGDPLPRVVLKFGQWHAMKGLNWGNVHAFGLFLSEFARSNDSHSLHIWTGLVNEPGRFWTLTEFDDYMAIGRAGSPDRWYVIDLRKIRPLVAAGQVDGMNDEMYKVIFGFDLALLIGGGSRATTDRIHRRR